MSGPKEFSRDWFIEQARESEKRAEELRRAFPGCFNAHGRAIIGEARLPVIPKATTGGPTP